MLTELMEHYGLQKDFRKAGYYETNDQKQKSPALGWAFPVYVYGSRSTLAQLTAIPLGGGRRASPIPGS